MKSEIILCVVLCVGWSIAGTDIHPRGCVYNLGQCVRDCDEGTHAYTTGCGYLTPEATCEEPNPIPDTRGQICDYSACYCDPPTVKNTVSEKCVLLEDCPK